MTQRAGWYDDPENPENLRYFDGVIWTSHTTPRAPASPAPAPAPAHVGPSPTAPLPHAPGAAPPWTDQGQQYAQQYPPAPSAYGSALGVKTTPDGQPLASYGQRVGAWFLDVVILLLVNGILAGYWIWQLARWYAGFVGDFLREAESGGQPTFDQAAIADQITGHVWPISLISFVVTVGYQVTFLTLKGATPGKMALGIAVRLRSRPGPLSVLDALKRQAVYIATSLLSIVPVIGAVSVFAKLLDILWPLWDENRQALHDKVAGTNVVVQPRKR